MAVMRRLSLLLLLVLLLMAAVPLSADTFTITPATGPTSGGTQVTVTRDTPLGTWPYGVIFGSTPAISTTRVDEHTLIAIAPPHIPGVVDIAVFEYDILLDTHLTFEYYGGIPQNFEQVLLPVFAPPVNGAFGSEFHTSLRIANNGRDYASIFGLEPVCIIGPCSEIPAWQSYEINPDAEITPSAVAYNGAPGRFLWAERNEKVDLSFNLRVHDVTRSDTNFGTEIPVVRENDWTINKLVLLGIPTDPRFRNTLRIYGKHPFIAKVTIGSRAPVNLPLSDTHTIFDVPYATTSDFPVDRGTIRVVIEALPIFSPTIGPIEEPIWAMVTVTNNDTQTITTITPQP